MTTIKKLTSALTTAALLTGLALNFNACSEQSPVSSETANNLTVKKELNILKLGISPNSLKKVTEVSKWITVQNGGQLSLYHENGDLGVEVELTILPGTISQDAEVKLTVDDENFMGNVDVVFSPHGVTFSQPAVLNMYAEGLDFSGYNLDDIDLYYDNQETGEWELMERDDFYIEQDAEGGEIRVTNGKLPHFSRYAIGAE